MSGHVDILQPLGDNQDIIVPLHLISIIEGPKEKYPLPCFYLSEFILF